MKVGGGKVRGSAKEENGGGGDVGYVTLVGSYWGY
jgi:hypothetical protein